MPQFPFKEVVQRSSRSGGTSHKNSKIKVQKSKILRKWGRRIFV